MGTGPLSSCPSLAYSRSELVGGVVNVRARSRSGRALQCGLRGVMQSTVDRRIGSSEEPYTHCTEPLHTCYPDRPALRPPPPHLFLDAEYSLRAFRHALFFAVRPCSVYTGIGSPREPYTHSTGRLDRYALHRPVRGSPYPQASLQARFSFLPPPLVTLLRGQISGRYTKQSLRSPSGESLTT